MTKRMHQVAVIREDHLREGLADQDECIAKVGYKRLYEKAHKDRYVLLGHISDLEDELLRWKQVPK
jgi:hypothetical protein